MREEIGDAMIFLTNLADKIGMDPIEAAKEKIEINKKKYPTELARGKAQKYTEF